MHYLSLQNQYGWVCPSHVLLWKDAADSILSVAASNRANDSLDSVKIPNAGKVCWYPIDVNDWTT